MSSSRCSTAGCSGSALSGKNYCLDHHKSQQSYSYGLDHELQKKLESKWDPVKAQHVANWVSALTHKPCAADIQTSLKSGVLLCELLNTIWPGTIPKINQGAMPFIQRENIVSYLSACKSKGMRETDLFVTGDLFEGSNLLVVVDNLCALGVLAERSGFRGTQLVVAGGAVQTTGRTNVQPAFSAQVAVPTAYTAPSHKSNTSTGSNSGASSSGGGGGGGPRFCGSCGTARQGSALFCGDCGGKF